MIFTSFLIIIAAIEYISFPIMLKVVRYTITCNLTIYVLSNVITLNSPFAMEGRFMIGLFRDGSLARHVIVDVFINATTQIIAIAASLSFSLTPDNVAVIISITGVFHILLGMTMVCLKSPPQEVIYSTSIIVRPVCCYKEQEVAPEPLPDP